MRANRSTWEVLGSLLGLVILLVILNSAVNYFRQGSSEFAEQSRVAGRPLTLTEILGGETVTGTETLTGTEGITGTSSVTGTADVTSTAATTDSASVDTSAVATTTSAVTETASVTTGAELTTTEFTTVITNTTNTNEITVTTTLTEAGETAEEPADETSSVEITSTDAPTATGALTDTEEVTATDEVSDAAETTGEAAVASPEVTAVFIKGGCIACHVIPGVVGAIGAIGPNLTNIGVDGATRIEGYSAEEYIRESLLDPNAFIAPECPNGPCLPNLMVQNLGDVLTEDELDAVVAYLAEQGTTAQ